MPPKPLFGPRTSKIMVTIIMVALFVGSLGAIYLHSLWFQRFSALNLPLRHDWNIESIPHMWVAMNSGTDQKSTITVYQITDASYQKTTRIDLEGLLNHQLQQQTVAFSGVHWNAVEYPFGKYMNCILIQGTTSRDIHTLCVLAREDQTLWVIHRHRTFTGENPPELQTLQEALQRDYHVVVGYALKGR